MINAVFPIAPVAWQRPRFNGNRAFTAPIVRKFENQVKTLALNFAPQVPMSGPLAVVINLYLEKPKRTKNKVPCVRPDIDNLIKILLDSFNEIFWFDDGQIVSLRANKIYCRPGEKPYFSILVIGHPPTEEPTT